MKPRDYWAALSNEHVSSTSVSAGADPIPATTALLFAGLCALTSGILLAAGGYHAGFNVMHEVHERMPVFVVEFLSRFGETLTAISLLAIVARRKPQVVWMAMLAGLYAGLCTFAIKRLCQAARPALVFGDGVVTSEPILRHFSFTSGHATTAFLLAACFSVGATRRARALLLAGALAVGLSRIMLGVHWPVDVLAGGAIAGLSIALAVRTMRYARWGLGLAPHLALVSMVAISALLELTEPRAALARGVSIAVGATALIFLARDYVIRPLRTARRRGAPLEADPKQSLTPRTPELPPAQ